MTITTKRLGASYVGIMSPGVAGEIYNDAVAYPSTTITAGAGGFQNLTVADNTGFSGGDMVDIVGAGPGGITDWYSLNFVGNNGSDSTTRVTLRQGKVVTTAVTDAVMTPYYFVETAFFPIKIKLTNKATLDEYHWKKGQTVNTGVKIDPNGVRTKMTGSFIIAAPNGFWIHPNLIPANATLEYDVAFEMPDFAR